MDRGRDGLPARSFWNDGSVSRPDAGLPRNPPRKAYAGPASAGNRRRAVPDGPAGRTVSPDVSRRRNPSREPLRERFRAAADAQPLPDPGFCWRIRAGISPGVLQTRQSLPERLPGRGCVIRPDPRTFSGMSTRDHVARRSPLPSPWRSQAAGRWTRRPSRGRRSRGAGRSTARRASSPGTSGSAWTWSRRAAGDRAGADAGGRPGSMRGNNPRPVSEEQARNEQQLVAEVKNPPAFLAITQTETVDHHHRRARPHAHVPPGRPRRVPAARVGPVATVTRWDGPRLVVRYKVQADRELRYTLSRASETAPAGRPGAVRRARRPRRRDAHLRSRQARRPGAGAARRRADRPPAARRSPLGQAAAGQPPAGRAARRASISRGSRSRPRGRRAQPAAAPPGPARRAAGHDAGIARPALDDAAHDAAGIGVARPDLARRRRRGAQPGGRPRAA